MVTFNNIPATSGLTSAQITSLKNAAKNGGKVNIDWDSYFSSSNIQSNGSSNFLTNFIQMFSQQIINNITGVDSQTGAEGTSNNEKEINFQKLKQGVEGELSGLKEKGVTISAWDNNNSCTLSYQGKKATITITDSGQISFGGDAEFIMDLLKQDPKEQTSVDNQNKFLEKMQKNGDPIVGDVITTSITVNGEEISVNKYTSESGKVYYLNDSGLEVTPDKTS